MKSTIALFHVKDLKTHQLREDIRIENHIAEFNVCAVLSFWIRTILVNHDDFLKIKIKTIKILVAILAVLYTLKSSNQLIIRNSYIFNVYYLHKDAASGNRSQTKVNTNY